eukprot:SM000073S21432  [mRNA]  locus=s73:216222:218947:+ [translate_table: standard]
MASFQTPMPEQATRIKDGHNGKYQTLDHLAPTTRSTTTAAAAWCTVPTVMVPATGIHWSRGQARQYWDNSKVVFHVEDLVDDDEEQDQQTCD